MGGHHCPRVWGVGVCELGVGVCNRRIGLCERRIGVCERRVGVYYWHGWSRLHIDDVDDGGFIPSVIQFPEHLAPGAPHAETGNGDVFAE